MIHRFLLSGFRKWYLGIWSHKFHHLHHLVGQTVFQFLLLVDSPWHPKEKQGFYAW